MKKHILTTIVFLILIFSGNSVFALPAPTGLEVECGTGTTISNCNGPLLSWDSTGARSYTVKYVKTTDNCSDVASTFNTSPTASAYVWKFLTETGALSAPFGSAESGKSYCWFVYNTYEIDLSDPLGIGPALTAALVIIPPTPPGPIPPGPFGPIILQNPLKADTLEEAFTYLFDWLFWLAVALTPILIIYAAFILAMAHGDPKQITKARTIIVWTIAAFAIVLLAKGIPSAIKGIFGAKQ